MNTKQLCALILQFCAVVPIAAHAATVVYDTSNGGLYNAVGPINNSPEFIGDRFTVSASGWLDSISLPLDNTFTFNGPIANGTINLWSDAGNVVGAPLFSANISATYFPPSNTVLPPFTQISANGSTPVFLSAGTYYWLTLSQTTGSGGLIGFSNVNLASNETVYYQNGSVHYATGLQAFVATIAVNVPEPSTGVLLLAGLALSIAISNSRSKPNRPLAATR